MIRVKATGYDAIIGSDLIDRIAVMVPPGRYFLVADRNVASAGWLDRAAVALQGKTIGAHVLPPGEASKTLATLEVLLDALLDAGIERDDQVMAVGGGAVGDVAGFAAAIAKRGCGFVQVPTSLLGQADAAIGGKTAINTHQGKNLVGAFHRPSAVIIDTSTLSTLPMRELRAGYAEIVKYGLIDDAAFFAWCEAHGEALIAGDEAARLHAIETSVRAKIARVEQDERDRTGARALLNFGHSFAHAIEAETDLAHGEAVALGMALAFRLSVERGHCPAGDAERVIAHLDAVGLPTRLERVDPGRMTSRLAHDKKASGGRPRLVLTHGIGAAFLDDTISVEELEWFLARERSANLGVL